jgi:YrbI family 3-deoxy-D-manno-octulosonate 8-phosphate phosphatase
MIKLFLSDVDGVLTDSGMYYTESGDEFKKFNTRDGMGFEILRKRNIKTGLITSEDSKIVERRALKLKIDYLYQGEKNSGKLNCAKDICQKLGISLREVSYIGDDINCLELLSSVGFPACPNDANEVIKNIPNIKILNSNGGDGVIREWIEFLIFNKMLS